MSTNPSDEFFTNGVQYYISGRFAVFSGFTPVAGNLLHNAIEFFLKGYLAKHLTLDELRKVSHDLNLLWKLFKACTQIESPSDFDSIVRDLGEFAELRYPDTILKNGAVISISIGKNVRPVTTDCKGRKLESYSIGLQNIDSLAELIFAKSSKNPAAFFGGLNKVAKDFLGNNNLSLLIDRV